jgi:hypothetical protein
LRPGVRPAGSALGVRPAGSALGVRPAGSALGVRPAGSALGVHHCTSRASLFRSVPGRWVTGDSDRIVNTLSGSDNRGRRHQIESSDLGDSADGC